MSETNTLRQYKDAQGACVRLERLVRDEPEWAANQIRHRDQIEQELNEANKSKRIMGCGYCGCEILNYQGPLPMDAEAAAQALDAFVKHDNECPRNPIRQERDALKAKMDRYAIDHPTICYTCATEQPDPRLAELEKQLAATMEDKANQGLTLVTLCDMVLGEDNPKRSDADLMRGVRGLINDVANHQPELCAEIRMERDHLKSQLTELQSITEDLRYCLAESTSAIANCGCVQCQKYQTALGRYHEWQEKQNRGIRER